MEILFEDISKIQCHFLARSSFYEFLMRILQSRFNPRIADVIPPCRYICQEVRRGCEPLLRLMGYSWPDEVECERFPTQAPCLNGTGLLFPSSTTTSTTTTQTTRTTTQTPRTTTQTPRTTTSTTSSTTTVDIGKYYHTRSSKLFNRFSLDCCSEVGITWTFNFQHL